MVNKTGKETVVDADMLVGYFLKLLQRDGAISNNTYLTADKMLKEEYDADKDKVHKIRN